MPTLRSLYSSFTERHPACQSWKDIKDSVSSYKMTGEACISLDDEGDIRATS